jgi:hypothetical protein
MAAEIGCTLGKGIHFGGPQPLYALAERDSAPRSGAVRGSALASN